MRDRRCWKCANCTLQRKCDEAESHFRQSCLTIITKAGQKNWRAMAWILERRYRNEYTTRTIIEVQDEEKRLPDPTEELIKAIWSGIEKSRVKRMHVPRKPPLPSSLTADQTAPIS